jgi:hypothetical protein
MTWNLAENNRGMTAGSPTPRGRESPGASMSQEANYVKIKPGVLTRMRFDRAVWEMKSIPDPKLGFSKDVNTLNFHVIELDGQTVSTVFSTTSTTLQEAIKPYLERDKYLAYRFVITRDSGGYAPPRIAAVTPV